MNCKVLRKIHSFILIIALLASTSFITASASDSVDELTPDVILRIESMLADIANYPEDFDIKLGDKITIGNRINTYKMDSKIDEFNDIRYYPLLSDSKIVAIVEIYGDPLCIAIGKGFADKLQAFAESCREFSMVYQNDNLFAVSREDAVLLEESPFTDLKKSVNSIAPVVDEAIFKENLEYLAVTSVCDLSADKHYNDDTVTLMSTPSSYQLSMTGKSQGSQPTCWAACIASIAQFMTHTSWTASSVCSKVGVYGGATDAQIAIALTMCGVTNNLQYSAPTGSQLITTIYNNGKPIMALCSSSSGANHTVVFKGYSSSSQGLNVTYMEPNGGTFKVLSASSGNYTFTSGGYTFTCTKSIIVTGIL